VAGTQWHSRSVEGDLGLRAGAAGVVAAAQAERLLGSGEADELCAQADLRAADPAFLSATETDHRTDARLATLAALVAVRRHARGRDLRRVRLVVGSGGVFRHTAGTESILATVLSDSAGGWSLPRAAAAIVDREYRLAPAGLLMGSHDRVARALLRPLAAATS
jgi:hypothetical protein